MTLSRWWPLSGYDGLRDELIAAYADPSRGYHDLRHLTEVLERLGELERAGADFDREPVLLAAWFHDSVYAGGGDDEELSARWAERALPEDVNAAEVARLVRLTATHRPDADDRNGCALSDADLAILAAPAERYREYVASVRREYAHVSDADFAAGRADVLADLLAKETLFHTTHARGHWEAAARANVGAELEGLRGLRPEPPSGAADRPDAAR
ncbi:HD domain-containing protein [Nocardioides sp. LHG3406-4]|uniref:HD domain-containing protein n=1 Tax=Nocardioides sp. LHG3406-4 TaxID=2804575 RepID=UPI003CEA8280